ncbi:hypothetical protein N474_22215 [Pseudoalteromonas luteoviolacea CPMOR-2]|uniref:Lipoprotein n=1 Tax=Pseudoalteromonas luteoviolacea DSM 6061 TaxID=1365250 RepID=A0A167D0X6_9GAMM|nr:hypothetical protein [Pseudoalteromonas luteoviolacea]KZN48291.1 hypothetical protein N475_25430 [Pseudoalteromonas luteoviolacea DSM 6061]KZN53070.1 hypothetical protein N474_22215 [Pseudoalteromonas luteoviolacea CPMOR-2]MBE0389536.1 hypothetical protein [Pseudoalteromonas luteoviolacea DSM 6061]
MVMKTFKSFVFLMATTTALSACADSAPKNKMKTYYGVYEVISVEKYRGGLTTQEEANKKIGGLITLCPTSFTDGDYAIAKPVYKNSRELLSKEEGVVPSDKNSAFYGFMSDREHIEYISIFEPDDTKNIYSRYEVIGNNMLMESYDGYFFKMILKSTCN